MEIVKEHFQVNLQDAALLFKRSVRIVEVEISSYCNRVCSFCPNSFVDRRSVKHFMSDALFENILRQLATIDYDGSFRIHRYNEPLATRSYALGRIRQIRSALPSALIFIYTNGDYLNRSYLDELYEAGVRGIRASAYSNTPEFDRLKMETVLRRRIEKLGYPYTFGSWGKTLYADVHAYSDLYFTYVSTDFSVGEGPTMAGNRGGALPVDLDYERRSPCVIPFREFHVEWDGTLMPCCNLRSDLAPHAGCSLGRLTESSDIFLAWSNSDYVRWRRELIGYEKKTGACAACSFQLVPEKPEVERFFKSAARYARERHILEAQDD